ncbi:MAG: hypothetical protein ACK4PI_09905 [Tepidisphaerales bacterium]
MPPSSSDPPLPLESAAPPPETPADAAQRQLSTPFLALMGAVAGGAPQLIIPTATVVELIGNTVMGALTVTLLDTLLVRQTLQGRQLRTGRMLLLLFVSVTLTLVTFKPASVVFQTVFGTGPNPNIRSLSASSYTARRLGNVGHRLTFTAERTALQAAFERMNALPDVEYTEFQPGTDDWATFVRTHVAGEPFEEAVLAFSRPEGFVWVTRSPRDPERRATTVLLRDAATGRAFAAHRPG